MDQSSFLLCNLRFHETIPIGTMHVSIVVTNKYMFRWEVFIQALQKYSVLCTVQKDFLTELV